MDGYDYYTICQTDELNVTIRYWPLLMVFRTCMRLGLYMAISVEYVSYRILSPPISSVFLAQYPR